MSEGIYITKIEFNNLVKDVKYLTTYVKSSLAKRNKTKWISQAEAMELLGCTLLKLKQLWFFGAIYSKASGKERV